MEREDIASFNMFFIYLGKNLSLVIWTMAKNKLLTQKNAVKYFTRTEHKSWTDYNI